MGNMLIQYTSTRVLVPCSYSVQTLGMYSGLWWLESRGGLWIDAPHVPLLLSI